MDLDIHGDGDGLCLASIDRVFINAWYGPPTVARLRDLHEAQRGIASRVGKHAVFALIDPRVGKEMTSEARDYSRQISADMKDHVLCNAFVVLGSGFFAALARTVIAGIEFVARPPYPWDVFTDAGTAVSWVSARVTDAGFPCASSELQRAVDEVLRRQAAVKAAPRRAVSG